MQLSIYISILLCGKDENTQKEAGIGPFKKMETNDTSESEEKVSMQISRRNFYLFKVSKGDKLFVGSFERNCHER